MSWTRPRFVVSRSVPARLNGCYKNGSGQLTEARGFMWRCCVSADGLDALIQSCDGGLQEIEFW